MFTGLRLITALLLPAILLAVIGCSRHYNGALTISKRDYDTVKAYHQAREQKRLSQQQAAEHPSGPGAAGTAGDPSARPGRSDAARVDELGRVFEPKPTPTPRPVSPRAQAGAAAPDHRASDSDPSGPAQAHRSNHSPARESEIEPVDEQDYVTTDGGQAPTPRASAAVSPYGNLPGERGTVSPLDSTGQIRRVSFTKEGADFDVTIDSSGEHLVYSSTRHRETADIYRQRIDGSAITQLTDDSANDVMPAMSPDGKTIAFASDRSGNWDLYLMDADGGPAVQLTSDTTHDIHPSFSPDGKTLVYCSLSDRSGQWELVTIDVDNPSTKRYIGHGLFPQWSPKGRTILYQRARERGTRWFSVWTVELDERGEAGSPTEVVWSSEYACITPSWSPDGKAVVFCTVTNPDADTQGRPAESDLWLARADGSGRTRLTRGRFSNLQPVWSGDNAIYFVSNRSTGGVENIWAMDPNDAVRVAFPGNGTKDTQTADVPTPTD